MKASDLGDLCKWRLLFSIFYQTRTPIHLSCFALCAGERRMWQQLQQANNKSDKKVEICQPKREHVQWDLSSGPRSSSECQSLDNMNSYGTVWPTGCTSSTFDHSSFDSWLCSARLWYLIRRRALLHERAWGGKNAANLWECFSIYQENIHAILVAAISTPCIDFSLSRLSLCFLYPVRCQV